MAVSNNGSTNIANAFDIFDNNYEHNLGTPSLASVAKTDLNNLRAAISSDSYALTPSQKAALLQDVSSLQGLVGKSGDAAKWQTTVSHLVADIEAATYSAPAKVVEDASTGNAYNSGYQTTYSALSTPDSSSPSSTSDGSSSPSSTSDGSSNLDSQNAMSSFSLAAGAAGVSGKLIATADSAVSSGNFGAFVAAAASIISTDSGSANDGVTTDLQQMMSAFTNVSTPAPSTSHASTASSPAPTGTSSAPTTKAPDKVSASTASVYSTASVAAVDLGKVDKTAFATNWAGTSSSISAAQSSVKTLTGDAKKVLDGLHGLSSSQMTTFSSEFAAVQSTGSAFQKNSKDGDAYEDALNKFMASIEKVSPKLTADFKAGQKSVPTSSGHGHSTPSTQDKLAPGAKVPTNSTASTALSKFDSSFSSVTLSGDDSSAANVDLQKMVDEAASTGDKTSFENVKTEIEALTGDTGVKDELDTIESSVSWQPDGGSKVISDALGNMAGSMSENSWNTKDASKHVQTFIDDFNAHKSADVLQQDANQIDYDMARSNPSTNGMNAELKQAIAYAQGGYKPGKDPNDVTISSAESKNPGVTNDPMPSSNSFSQNDATMNTVKSFDSDFGGVRLDGNFASGTGNQMLQAELDSAVKAGDKTAFENLKSFIESATGDSGVKDKLDAIESSASWASDGGKASIATALSTAAGMMASGAWNTSSAQQDMQQFINDFIDGKDGGTLSTDANTVVNDLGDSWGKADINGYMQKVLQQAVAYGDGGYKPGVDPNKVTVSQSSDD